jgi:methyl-accepting chemotaxis protein
MRVRSAIRGRGIALRLAVGFGAVLLLLLAVAGAGVLQLQRLQRQADELVTQHIAMLDALGRMQESGSERALLLRDLVLGYTVDERGAVERQLKSNGVTHSEASNRLADVADASRVGAARDAMQRVVELGERLSALEKSLLEYVAAWRMDDAKAVLAELGPQQQGMNRLLRESFVATMADADRSVKDNRTQHRWMLMIVGASAGLCVLLGVAIAFFTGRGILRPVGEAKATALRIASGDLAQPITARSRDEVGQLVDALELMRQALSGSVADIRQAAERVRGGATRIEQGSGDLASRTEEQAASLEESASSMEEFTATVQQNAQSASEASNLARNTSDVAARGGEAVRGVVATMQGIHSASARIGDIIGVIDGIAFQTNILALNAAVEAARAGEQGRGFAVVASEVRSLAQRSAEAAKEIKALIQDATGRVDGGVRQVEAAGRTMDEIVGSVKKVNALVAEIAHASAEQLAGIEQVNRAIAQMDGNTQRNAALVQQAAESAQEMAGEAAHLVETVAKFKLADAQPAQAAQPAPREEPVTLRELPRRRQAPRFVATMPPDSEMLSLPAPLN